MRRRAAGALGCLLVLTLGCRSASEGPESASPPPARPPVAPAPWTPAGAPRTFDQGAIGAVLVPLDGAQGARARDLAAELDDLAVAGDEARLAAAIRRLAAGPLAAVDHHFGTLRPGTLDAALESALCGVPVGRVAAPVWSRGRWWIVRRVPDAARRVTAWTTTSSEAAAALAADVAADTPPVVPGHPIAATPGHWGTHADDWVRSAAPGEVYGPAALGPAGPWLVLRREAGPDPGEAAPGCAR